MLMDEKGGRQCGASLGFRTNGVLGVLISAMQSGSVSSLRSEIETLRRVAGFFVDKDLETRILAMVGEGAVALSLRQTERRETVSRRLPLP